MTELAPEECWEVLRAGRVAHVAVVADDEPYVTPLSYVVLGGAFLFRSGPGRRASAIEAGGRVCVEVTHLEEGGCWRSVLFWGAPGVVDDPARHAEVVAALLAKYPDETAPGFSAPASFPEERRVVEIIPERMTGRSGRGDGTTPGTRPGRL